MNRDSAQAATRTEPVVKEVSVPLPVERAFELFTAHIAGWWPLATHSIARESAVECRFEPRVGGRLLEIAADGSEHVWGTLREWQPPERLVMSWHPGRAAETAQQVTVTFAAEEGGTRLRLVHDGWDAVAQLAPRERDDYDAGWDYVLGRYVARTG